MADLCVLIRRKSATPKIKVLTTAACVWTVASFEKAIGCISWQMERLDRTTQDLRTTSDEDNDLTREQGGKVKWSRLAPSILFKNNLSFLS